MRQSQYEGDLVRKFMSEQKMVRVSGDRHCQYVSKDAGEWSQQNFYPEHIYLNVVGGFLEGSVFQLDGKPRLIFRHDSPDGDLLNEYIVDSQ
ncbi:MAG: hypothetical protein HOK84_00110 [Bacteroidetes bacterium]|jgi:alkaline phosphatase D|nr:hypothetical protein [Bacteroidota bacterium]MBT5424560.1 hypothetical protein [Bacteroidota bacterium]MBT7465906.1 hypothetical protein [Bacteroidota bacterium]